MNAKKIIITIEKNKENLKKFGVKKIGLFGSYAKGKQKKGSDVDLLVSLDKRGIENYFDLWVYLEKLLRRKVDLVLEKNLYPRIRYVKKEAVYVRL